MVTPEPRNCEKNYQQSRDTRLNKNPLISKSAQTLEEILNETFPNIVQFKIVPEQSRKVFFFNFKEEFSNNIQELKCLKCSEKFVNVETFLKHAILNSSNSKKEKGKLFKIQNVLLELNCDQSVTSCNLTVTSVTSCRVCNSHFLTNDIAKLQFHAQNCAQEISEIEHKFCKICSRKKCRKIPHETGDILCLKNLTNLSKCREISCKICLEEVNSFPLLRSKSSAICGRCLDACCGQPNGVKKCPKSHRECVVCDKKSQVRQNVAFTRQSVTYDVSFCSRCWKDLKSDNQTTELFNQFLTIKSQNNA